MKQRFPLPRDSEDGQKLLQALQLISSVVYSYRGEDGQLNNDNTATDNETVKLLEQARDIIGKGIQGWEGSKRRLNNDKKD